ncbi:hypothetical protein LCGC14_2451700 [marine sediment metagenome]|uniref:Uncharacterized protein n=1 Tax=marine sediment metagenome TaxID=412755 RepID=A0A0F9BFY7_9ZZZZ
MSGAVTLSRFNPSKRARAPHREIGKDGRTYFKGKRISTHYKNNENSVCNPPTPRPVFPSDLDGLIGHPQEVHGKLGFSAKYKLQDLIVAIKEIEDERAINPDELSADSLMEHFVRRAFKSDSVLKDIMKKLLPDLKHVEADIELTEQFQLIIDATGSDDEDDIVDVKALPAPNASNAGTVSKRRVRVRRKRKSA